jgi:ketosteroid isomerase-like protein
MRSPPWSGVPRRPPGSWPAARRGVNGADVPTLDPDLARQREVVDAFFAAARAGDFEELVQLLDPDVVVHSDFGGGRPPAVFRGAQVVAKLSRPRRGAEVYRRVLVNGTPGAVITLNGKLFSVLAFTVVGGKIVQIDGIADPDRVRRVAAAVLTDR